MPRFINCYMTTSWHKGLILKTTEVPGLDLNEKE